jgi:competence protein ComEC
MQAPLVPVTIAFVVGLILGWVLPLSLPLLAVAAGLSAWGAVRTRPRSRWTVAALLTLWGCLGMGRMTLWRMHPEHRLAALVSETPQPVKLHGMVINDPTDWISPTDIPTETALVAVRHLQHSPGHWQPVQGRVQVRLAQPRTSLRYGDELLLEGTWERPAAAGNPGQYDVRQALARQRIHGLLRVRPYDGVAILSRDRGLPSLDSLSSLGTVLSEVEGPLLTWVFRLRDRWSQWLGEVFDAPQANLLRSLLLGQRVALDEDLKDAFVVTGTMHLLVISGSHVGIVALLFEWILRLLGLPWRGRLFVVGTGLGIYCLLAGMNAPVVRATIMAWTVLAGMALGRVINWFNILAAAALVILWLGPTQLFDAGFQLSFGAVASLLLLAGRWSEPIASRMGWCHPAWLRRYVALSLSSTAAIWVGLWPVLAWYFYLISPVSMIANLLLVPLVGALIMGGMGALLVSPFIGIATSWSQVPLGWLVRAVEACVFWCRDLPGGFWYLGQPPWWVLVGYYSLVGVSLIRRRLGWSRARCLACWLLAINGWVWAVMIQRVLDARWLTVDVLDVGHGDSCLLRTPSGHTLLVDAGTQEAGRFRVLPYLHWAGIRHLDALLLTHLDEDHIGGAIPVLEHIEVKQLLTNGARNATMTFRRIEELVAQRRVPHHRLWRGRSFTDALGVELDILHPPDGFVPGTEPGENDNSIVVRLRRSSVKILLTGDIEEMGLHWLLSQGDDLTAMMLKVPHHGSALGDVAEPFVRAVHPSLALISVGRLHHLPSRATLDTLAAVGAQTLLTVREGAIRIRSDGTRLLIRTQRGHSFSLTP